VYKYAYVPFFRRRSTIVIGGVVALFGFLIKDLYAESTKDIAAAIQSAKDGYDNELRFADLSNAVASNFFLLEVIQRRIEENAPDVGGHAYNRDLGEALNVYKLNKTELEKIASLIAKIPDNAEINDKLRALQNEVKVLGSRLGVPPASEHYTLQDMRIVLDEERAELQAKSQETDQFVKEALAKADEVKNRNERYHSACQVAALALFAISIVLTVGAALSEAKRIPLDPQTP
jgi:hypothetical protein